MPRKNKKSTRDPAECFREERAYISCEADEDITYLVQLIGEDAIMVASDFPHGDPSVEEGMVDAIMEREDIPLSVREKILSANPQSLYRL